MPRRILPDALTRREWLEETLDPARAGRVAEAYLAEGRLLEALPFLEQAGERERMRALAEEATSAGDAFLLREIARRLGEEPPAERWQALAEAAAAAGKELYASEARRQAERRRGGG